MQAFHAKLFEPSMFVINLYLGYNIIVNDELDFLMEFSSIHLDFLLNQHR